MIRCGTGLAVALVAGVLAGRPASAVDEYARGTPLAAKWEYSMDGGKTFSPQAPTITAKRTADDAADSVTARATFEVADPDAIGLIKLMVGEIDGSVALTDAESIDRYNVGTRPNLTMMKMTINGQPTDAGLSPATLYRYAPIDPKLVKKGANEMTVSGVYWFQLAEATAGSLRLLTLPANVVELDRLPVITAISDEAFGLAARSLIPAEFTVTVKPLDPAGDETKQKIERTRQLKARLTVPKGTRKLQYTVAVSAGGASKSYGPYEVKMPTTGEGFRFLVAGNTAVYQGGSERLKNVLAKILEVQPDVFIHTGKYVDCTPWDFMWTDLFFNVNPEPLARIPMLPCCGFREMGSPTAFSRSFFFPPEDKDFGCWTVAFGKVRFVAFESWSFSQDKSGESLKWLDQMLSDAKEDYLVVLNPQVSHCSTPNAGRAVRPVTEYVAANIDPLLVKHKVTVTIGGHHTAYERVEPPAGESVPTIMTCFAGGSGKPLQQCYVDENKFSRATYRGDHYVLFEVKKDKLAMQTVGLDGTVADTCEFSPRK